MSDPQDTEKRRSILQSLPSDYTEMQPRDYDPQFISDISHRMQVPDSLHAAHNGTGYNQSSRLSGGWESESRGPQMNVPEKIIVTGGGQHIGAKPEIRGLHFDSMPRASHEQPVQLQTPPRTLTIEEQFAHDSDEEEDQDVYRTPKKIPNGTMAVPEPYTPGMSTSDSLLLNEEDEATQMRTQMSKLMRRVAVLERDQKTQATREMYLYTAQVGYFLIKFIFWLLRDK